ncbi:MAG: ChbG/HpnK family deacetylase [Nitrospirae bacterium]|nr:ChbG/HpnK family deacetylase [Nitrospirota bacterium]
MRIDLHADDFGATHTANNNIIAAWRAGALDGVSVFANGDALQHAVAEVNSDIRRPLRIAVHLNLNEGYALTDRSKVALLINDKGRFCHGFLGIWNLYRSSDNAVRQQFLQQVETEWREQIRRIIEVFPPRSIISLDGHVHVHMLPFLFPIAAQLAREFGLSQIRISREVFHFSLRKSFRFGFPLNIVKHILLNFLSRPAFRIAKESGLASPDAIAGILYSASMTYQTALAAVRTARKKQLNWLEIVFHPGRATPEEAYRWAGGKSAVMDPHRDVERNVLIDIGAKRL